MQKKIIAIAVSALFLTACAGHGSYVENEKPAYWMKQYASADQAKVNRCYRLGDAAYDKAVSDTSWGNNGFAVLAKGNAWEACMDGK